MHLPVVFLNKGLASTVDILRLICAERLPNEFRLVASHPRPDFPGRLTADAFEVEPDRLDTSEYIAWCLDFARRHRVSLFVPGRKAAAIAAARQRFETAGMRLLLAGDAKLLALLDDKAACYAALGPEIVPRPEHVVVNDLASFDSAIGALRSLGHRVCFKPTTSVYGRGFHTLVNTETALSGDPSRITIENARKYLDRRPFERQLVMEYLPGKERSVDCLAQRGRLILAIIRKKGIHYERDATVKRVPLGPPDREVVSVMGSEPQWIEENPRLEGVVRNIASHLGLDGMFNAQFRDDRQGIPHLLEINGRMSGGLPMACQTGVAVPYWAIRLALGTAQPNDVPSPRVGFVVSPEGPLNCAPRTPR